ncbi:hypothetical protein M138_2390 [Bacteroides fragilis str. S23L17]|nr:hypothetical protein M138_2390 [Bacteroides fragilis str. S23L17]
MVTKRIFKLFDKEIDLLTNIGENSSLLDNDPVDSVVDNGEDIPD